MVVQLATHPAFRARPTGHLPVLLPMVQIHMHFAFRQLQFHSFHQPRRFEPKNFSVKFAILHSMIVDQRYALQSQNSPPRIAAAVDRNHLVVAADSEMTEIAAARVELLHPAVIAVRQPNIPTRVDGDPNRAIASELARAAPVLHAPDEQGNWLRKCRHY